MRWRGGRFDDVGRKLGQRADDVERLVIVGVHPG